MTRARKDIEKEIVSILEFAAEHDMDTDGLVLLCTEFLHRHAVSQASGVEHAVDIDQLALFWNELLHRHAAFQASKVIGGKPSIVATRADDPRRVSLPFLPDGPPEFARQEPISDDVAYLALQVQRTRRELELTQERLDLLEAVYKIPQAPTPRTTVPNEIGELRDSVFGFLSDLTLGDALPDVRISRYLPVRIFLEQARADDMVNMRLAFEAVCSACNLEVERSLFPLKGSVLRRWWTRTKDFVTRREVSERLEKLERAVELKAIDKEQASVDKDEAEAVNKLLATAQNTPNAAFQVGSLLVVKRTDSLFGERVIAVTLTQKQMAVLNRNIGAIMEPQSIFRLLREVDPEASDDRLQKAADEEIQAEESRGTDKKQTDSETAENE